MTREGTRNLIRMICDIYPTFGKTFAEKSQDEKTEMIDAWMFMLEDFNNNDIAMALKTYINTNESAFAPSISQLIGMVHKPKEMAYLPEMEAWSLVSKAIRKSNYYSEEEFEKLPEMVQKALGSPSQLRIWASDNEFNESVVSSNFMRTYRSVVERDKEFQRMPQVIKDRIAIKESIGIEEKRNG